MTKILFYFENKHSEKYAATWVAGLMWLGFIGWIFAGGMALVAAQGEVRSTLLWWSLTLPALGLVSALIQTLFGMRRYFLPTLINTSVCTYLSLGLILLFTLISLYSLLSLHAWLVVTVLIIVSHFLMWYYNQKPSGLVAKAMLRDYRQGYLSTEPHGMTFSISVPSRTAPKWLSRLAFYGVGLLAFVLVAGSLTNHMGVVPYAFSSGTLVITLGLTYYAAAPCHTFVFCAVNLARQLQRKDEIKEAKRNARQRKRLSLDAAGPYYTVNVRSPRR